MVDYYYERYSYNRIRAGAGSRPANGCITCRRTLHIFLITQTDPCTCIFCVLSFAGSSTTATKIKKNCHNIEHTGRRHLKLSRTSNNRKNRKKKTEEKNENKQEFCRCVWHSVAVPSRYVPFMFRFVSFRYVSRYATCSLLCSGTLLPFGCLGRCWFEITEGKRARVRLANPKDTAEMAPTLAGLGLLLLLLAKLSPTDLCQRFLCQLPPLTRSFASRALSLPASLSRYLSLSLSHSLSDYLSIYLAVSRHLISRELSLPHTFSHAHSLFLSVSHFRLVNVSVSVFFYVAFGGRLFLARVCVCYVCVCQRERARCCLL